MCFPFSPREGTPAAQDAAAGPRLDQERAPRGCGRRVTRPICAIWPSFRGTRQKVLIEKPGIGRTEGFTLVRLDGGEAGTIVEVDIHGHDGSMLTGTQVPQTGGLTHGIRLYQEDLLFRQERGSGNRRRSAATDWRCCRRQRHAAGACSRNAVAAKRWTEVLPELVPAPAVSRGS